MIRLTWLLGLLLVVGCVKDAWAPFLSSDPVRTDALSYVLVRVSGNYDYYAVARVRYTNPGPTAIFFPRCNGWRTKPMYGIRREGNPELSAALGISWGCVGGVPMGRIEPGETVELEVSLGSHDSPNANPPILMEHRTGTFRILLRLCQSAEEDSAECDLVPDEDRRSNVFEVLPPN